LARTVNPDDMQEADREDAVLISITRDGNFFLNAEQIAVDGLGARSRWPDDYQSMPLTRALLTLHRTARVYKSESILIDPLTGREWPALGPSSS
jgi:hypothetical protein